MKTTEFQFLIIMMNEIKTCSKLSLLDTPKKKKNKKQTDSKTLLCVKKLMLWSLYKFGPFSTSNNINHSAFLTRGLLFRL